MENEKQSAITIMRLQDNLSTLRKICGWTTQQLGDKIGVTKQTISNLENGKTTMSKLQYMGLRLVFQDEVEVSSSENAKLLKLAMDKLLDAELSSEEMDEYESKMRGAASIINDGTEVEQASKLLGFHDEYVQESNCSICTNISQLSKEPPDHKTNSKSNHKKSKKLTTSAINTTVATGTSIIGAAAMATPAIVAGITTSVALHTIKRSAAWLSRLNDELT